MDELFRQIVLRFVLNAIQIVLKDFGFVIVVNYCFDRRSISNKDGVRRKISAIQRRVLLIANTTICRWEEL